MDAVLLIIASSSGNRITSLTKNSNLANNGTDSDSYTLTVANPNAAATTALNISSPVSLNAGQSRIFSLMVSNTSAGVFDVSIIAASVNDPSKFAHVNTTTAVIDITPHSSIRNLQSTNFTRDYINWAWVDPSDSDFSRVMIYLDGIFQTNVSKGVQNYVATGLSARTQYNLSTHTVDTSGNINQTWVNNTVTTGSRKKP